jgi:cytochrome c-type biogenesis protein CcmF
MGPGVHLQWNRDSAMRVIHSLGMIAGLSVVLPLLLLLFLTKNFNSSVFLGLVLAFWIILSTGKALINRIRQQGRVSLAFYGMVTAHIGVAVTVIGIVVSCGYGMQDDVKMAPGTSVLVGNYQVKFVREMALTGPNYHGSRVQFILQGSHRQAKIYPEKRIYETGRMAMTESAIDVTPFRDIYVALGEPLDDTAWSVRLYYKPFVRWIWGGGFLIFTGGLLALLDRRYYTRRERQ